MPWPGGREGRAPRGSRRCPEVVASWSLLTPRPTADAPHRDHGRSRTRDQGQELAHRRLVGAADGGPFEPLLNGREAVEMGAPRGCGVPDPAAAECPDKCPLG